ncbi:N-acetyllactosaminide 3-alpha-galactosyltransferase, partial [Opisthorchis viverrini]
MGHDHLQDTEIFDVTKPIQVPTCVTSSKLYLFEQYGHVSKLKLIKPAPCQGPEWIIILIVTTVIVLTLLNMEKLLPVFMYASLKRKLTVSGKSFNVVSTLQQLQASLPPYAVKQQTCSSICKDLPVDLTSQERNLKLVGNLTITKEDLASKDLQNLSRELEPHVNGGSWMYRDPSVSQNRRCDVSDHSAVTIIIPLRNRWHQVPALLSTLIPLLRKQKICHRIFIVEQADDAPFNRAKLFNVGFVEAIKLFRFGCVIFHDVDLVPINDLNPYGCDKEVSKNVIHLGVGLDVRNFKLSYPQLVGGVLKMTTEQFVSVNGFSNKYWGWGQEDDDMERRLRRRNLNYVHISPSIARYAAMTHDKQPKVRRDEHLDLLKSAHMRMINDGLNTLKYRLIYVQEKSLFTLILVDL